MSEVDFIINVWEGTYRTVLQPGYIKKILDDNRFAFRKVTVLINNIDDMASACSLSERLISVQEIDAYVSVAEHLDRSIAMAGLTKDELGPIPFYSDWAIVAVFLLGNAPWICHWDAEVHLKEPFDWISPAIALMNRDKRISVANPSWTRGAPGKEALAVEGDFHLGYGFSDQVFLLRTAEFAQPIYRYFAPASLRYPFAHVCAIFEQRVDSYMRTTRRLRATHIYAQYSHQNEGKSYPRLTTIQAAKKALYRAALASMRTLPTDDPRWKTCPRQ
jgi:hypothetical protein